MTNAHLNRIENGRQQPHLSALRKLATALGVDPAELAGWETMVEGGEAKAQRVARLRHARMHRRCPSQMSTAVTTAWIITVLLSCPDAGYR